MTVPRSRPDLSGIPHVIRIALLQHVGTIDLVLPPCLWSWSQDDFGRFAPMNAILAFDQGHAPLGPPGEPHPVGFALFQDGDIETRAVLATHDRTLLGFQPTCARLSDGGDRG